MLFLDSLGLSTSIFIYVYCPTMFAHSFAAKSTITQGAILHAEGGLIGHSSPFFCG